MAEETGGISIFIDEEFGNIQVDYSVVYEKNYKAAMPTRLEDYIPYPHYSVTFSDSKDKIKNFVLEGLAAKGKIIAILKLQLAKNADEQSFRDVKSVLINRDRTLVLHSAKEYNDSESALFVFPVEARQLVFPSVWQLLRGKSTITKLSTSQEDELYGFLVPLIDVKGKSSSRTVRDNKSSAEKGTLKNYPALFMNYIHRLILYIN